MRISGIRFLGIQNYADKLFFQWIQQPLLVSKTSSPAGLVLYFVEKKSFILKLNLIEQTSIYGIDFYKRNYCITKK